ncbi:MAG: family 16 glycosylhydrolase [Fermentimonas sp.]
MKRVLASISIMFFVMIACGSKDESITIPEEPKVDVKWEISPKETIFSSLGETKKIIVGANASWTAESDQKWVKLNPSSGKNGQTSVELIAEKSNTDERRVATITFKSEKGDYSHTYQLVQEAGELIVEWSFEPVISDFKYEGETKEIVLNTNGNWEVSYNADWLTLSKKNGSKGRTVIEATATTNNSGKNRIAELNFVSGDYSKIYYVNQETDIDENYVPAGYNLVWSEEFNADRMDGGKPALPDSNKWWYEIAEAGWVNHEKQTYIDNGFIGEDTTAAIYDGTLKIRAIPREDKIYSSRMNTTNSWTYGYFEARLRVPGGKGTWPAFWMMPKNYTSWPMDGEIDIMEYVGYDPNNVHVSIHTEKYNHVKGTQKTGTKVIENAEIQFHIYGLEWTAEYIKGFVDGEEIFSFENDGKKDKETWPFDAPFYLKLNLAWGGDWGGAQGIDETALPATYEIDYVRVYKK